MFVRACPFGKCLHLGPLIMLVIWFFSRSQVPVQGALPHLVLSQPKQRRKTASNKFTKWLLSLVEPTSPPAVELQLSKRRQNCERVGDTPAVSSSRERVGDPSAVSSETRHPEGPLAALGAAMFEKGYPSFLMPTWASIDSGMDLDIDSGMDLDIDSGMDSGMDSGFVDQLSVEYGKLGPLFLPIDDSHLPSFVDLVRVKGRLGTRDGRADLIIYAFKFRERLKQLASLADILQIKNLPLWPQYNQWFTTIVKEIASLMPLPSSSQSVSSTRLQLLSRYGNADAAEKCELVVAGLTFKTLLHIDPRSSGLGNIFLGLCEKTWLAAKRKSALPPIYWFNVLWQTSHHPEQSVIRNLVPAFEPDFIRSLKNTQQNYPRVLFDPHNCGLNRPLVRTATGLAMLTSFAADLTLELASKTESGGERSDQRSSAAMHWIWMFFNHWLQATLYSLDEEYGELDLRARQSSAPSPEPAALYMKQCLLASKAAFKMLGDGLAGSEKRWLYQPFSTRNEYLPGELALFFLYKRHPRSKFLYKYFQDRMFGATDNLLSAICKLCCQDSANPDHKRALKRLIAFSLVFAESLEQFRLVIDYICLGNGRVAVEQFFRLSLNHGHHPNLYFSFSDLMRLVVNARKSNNQMVSRYTVAKIVGFAAQQSDWDLPGLDADTIELVISFELNRFLSHVALPQLFLKHGPKISVSRVLAPLNDPLLVKLCNAVVAAVLETELGQARAAFTFEESTAILARYLRIFWTVPSTLTPEHVASLFSDENVDGQLAIYISYRLALNTESYQSLLSHYNEFEQSALNMAIFWMTCALNFEIVEKTLEFACSSQYKRPLQVNRLLESHRPLDRFKPAQPHLSSLSTLAVKVVGFEWLFNSKDRSLAFEQALLEKLVLLILQSRNELFSMLSADRPGFVLTVLRHTLAKASKYYKFAAEPLTSLSRQQLPE